MTEEQQRGSSFLRARYTEADFEELVSAGAAAGARLEDAFPLGLPAFDGAAGTFKVGVEQLPDLIAALSRLAVVPHLKVFPKGLPSVETFDVSFEVGSRRSV